MLDVVLRPSHRAAAARTVTVRPSDLRVTVSRVGHRRHGITIEVDPAAARENPDLGQVFARDHFDSLLGHVLIYALQLDLDEADPDEDFVEQADQADLIMAPSYLKTRRLTEVYPVTSLFNLRHKVREAMQIDPSQPDSRPVC